jgi:uncharacterized membrane protein
MHLFVFFHVPVFIFARIGLKTENPADALFVMDLHFANSNCGFFFFKKRIQIEGMLP